MRSSTPRLSRSTVTTTVTTRASPSSHRGGRPTGTSAATTSSGEAPGRRRTAPLVTTVTVPGRDLTVTSLDRGTGSGDRHRETLEGRGQAAVHPGGEPGAPGLVGLVDHLAVPVHPGDQVAAVVGHQHVDLDVGVRQPGGHDLAQLLDAGARAGRDPHRTWKGPAEGEDVVLAHRVHLVHDDELWD